MLHRGELVIQMAKVFSGADVVEPAPLREEDRRRADEALKRVEIYLGIDVEEAKDILVRVLEDVS